MSKEEFIFMTNYEENIEKSQKLSIEYNKVNYGLFFFSAT